MRLRLITIGLLAVSLAPGQRGGGGMGGRGGGGGGMEMGSFGAQKQNRLDVLSKVLELSKEQKKEIKALMDEGQKEAAGLKEQMSKSRAQIAAAVEGGKQDEIDKAIQSHSELEVEMGAIEMKAFAGLYKVLDSDQRNKMQGIYRMFSGVFRGKSWTEAE